MISLSKRTKIRALRQKGLGHRQIAKALGVGLGTAFEYSKGVELTNKQKQKLKMQTALGASKKLKVKWGVKGGKMTKFRIKYSRGILVDMIRDFYFKTGRIPTKREFNTHWQSFRRVFGTWNNAIKASKLEPNPVMFAKKYIANDGHKCDSLSEKIIDDWFYARGIKHEINYPYPGGDGFTADFKVGDFWIEFFGLSGEHKRYDQLKKQKLRLIQKYKLKLIEIYPKHLFPKSKLSELLGILIN